MSKLVRLSDGRDTHVFRLENVMAWRVEAALRSKPPVQQETPVRTAVWLTNLGMTVPFYVNGDHDAVLTAAVESESPDADG